MLKNENKPELRETTSCQWREDVNGDWNSTCELNWEFTYEIPAENHISFCPKCGRKVEIIPLPDPEDGEALHAND